MEPVSIVMIRMLKRNALIRNTLKALVLLALAFNLGNVIVNGSILSGAVAVTCFVFFFIINQAGIK